MDAQSSAAEDEDSDATVAAVAEPPSPKSVAIVDYVRFDAKNHARVLRFMEKCEMDIALARIRYRRKLAAAMTWQVHKDIDGKIARLQTKVIEASNAGLPVNLIVQRISRLRELHKQTTTKSMYKRLLNGTVEYSKQYKL